MFKLTQRPQKDSIEVAIGPRSIFRGTLESDTSIQIEGVFDGGRIETPANVIMTETATVECNITAKTVSIRGEYSGILHADRVELLAGSKICGELHVNSFFLDDDVILNASLNVQDNVVNAGLMRLPQALTAPVEETHTMEQMLVPGLMQGAFDMAELTQTELAEIIPAHRNSMIEESTEELQQIGHRHPVPYAQTEQRPQTEEVKSIQPVLLKYMHRAKRKTLAHMTSQSTLQPGVGSPVPA